MFSRSHAERKVIFTVRAFKLSFWYLELAVWACRKGFRIIIYLDRFSCDCFDFFFEFGCDLVYIFWPYQDAGLLVSCFFEPSLSALSHCGCQDVYCGGWKL
jgi:hypothetical protein